MNETDDRSIAQVCIIVEDVEKSADTYRKIFAWEIPEDYEITGLYEHSMATHNGKPTDARAKIARCGIGSIQFELVQPLEPPSSWQDFLDQSGEGIHHIAFFVPETEAALQSYSEHGFQVFHQGLFTGASGKYSYLDTDKGLGIVIELLEVFDGSRPPKGSDFDGKKGIGTDVICQVGIIVEDIVATSQRVSEVLHLPQPDIIETPGYAVSKTIYRGAPSEATAKLAFFDTGQVQIELIAPDEKPSVWRDFLEAKGEGAQHIAFRIKDTTAVTDYFSQHGIEVVQQGLFADGSGMYTYLDSDGALGTTVELLESFA